MLASFLAASIIYLYANIGAETYNFSFDFADNLIATRRLHKSSATVSYQYNDSLTYDHWGRMSKHFIKDPTVTAYTQISLKSYNHRDFLTTLGLDYTTATPLQNLTYAYNDQGWLTNINAAPSATGSSFMSPQAIPGATNIPAASSLFKLDIRYNNPTANTNTYENIYKNGNISQIWYQVNGKAPEGYGYQYDFLDRLTRSAHVTYNNTAYSINNYQENIDYADLRACLPI